METKEHRFTGTTRIDNRTYVGHCSCGWQSPFKRFFEYGQNAVQLHIDAQEERF